MSSELHNRWRKDGVTVSKKRIIVRFEEQEYEVSWYSGASDEAIAKSIDIVLGLTADSPAMLVDASDGVALAISDSIPDGLVVDAKRSASTASLQPWQGGNGGGSQGRHEDCEYGDGATHRGESSDDGYHDKAEKARMTGHGASRGGAETFRGEMLKFERVNAHLANERTWLAWVRTALSVMSLALSFLSLADDMNSDMFGDLALALGIGFVLCVLFTYVTGWLRYSRVKLVLSWKSTEVQAQFGRFGLGYQARFLGVALALAIPLYIVGGIDVVTD